MGASGVSDEYKPPRLSQFLHALPHINVTLHRSLGILGSIPGAWLILTLTVLLIYLLTRCCDRKQRPPKSITTLKITLMILSVLCCGAIGSHILEEAMGSRAQEPLIRIADALDQPVANQTALGTLLRALSALRLNASAAVSAAEKLREPLLTLKLDEFMKVGALGALVACWLATAVLAAGAMVHYYLSCKVSRENVLTAELRNAQRAVVAVRQALAILSRGAPPMFNDQALQPALGALGAGTGEAERALVSLSGALERAGTGEEQAPFLSSGASSAASRTLPRPAPFPNGKPPSYSAAVQLMDLADREPRPRY
ncbi:Uncharacterized protein OBRU01_15572 [Operophtera brumata]|uniref:Protein tweety homolog n=1 Tax=Operophtera brumata TaxID=104452 RepID=A0A0L7KWP9_OPEBR|nr:Uncharacterized protein OBRU01_15572 [Operophtera brumata]